MGSPREVGAPSVEGLVEGSVKGEGEGALEEGASAWPGDQDRGKLLQYSLEVASAYTHVVEGKANQTAGSRRLDGA